MSEKIHCDVCDIIIGMARGGRVEARPLHGLEDGEKPMDLCLPHYNSYKQTVHEWVKLMQGGMASFPTQRILTGNR